MDNYFIENKETGKIELHFDKSTYMALSEIQKKAIKSNFLFSRSASAWVSRCKFPNLYSARQVALSLGLTDNGATGERLSFADQMEIKSIKADNRADKFEYKAAKAIEKGKELQKPINDMHGDIAFFTQPNINTSSGRAFTRKRDRMWASYEQGMDEFRKSEYYMSRAKSARESLKTPSIDFCQRRIDEATASIRKLNKNIAEYEDRLNKVANNEPVHDMWGNEIKVDVDSLSANIERWNEILENEIGKVAYYDALIQQQGGINFSKENIKPGYIVKLRSSWKGRVLVTRTGPKNIRYRDIDGSGFELQANYSEIESIIEAKEEVKLHPFEVGEKFTVKAWDGNSYVDKEYTITKVTNDKVSVKSGTTRAKAIMPRKTYDGKSFILYVEDNPRGYYSKAI